MLNKKEIAEYFVYGKWTEADVDKAVTKGHLTAEEAAELREALDAEGDAAGELGDLMLSCADVARALGEDPEALLKAATDKFIDRFTRLESAILEDGKSLSSMSREEKDLYWDRIKHIH